MYKDKKILTIIPVRGGSKGIPKKNIIRIKNRILLDYTLECAENSKYIDKIIISTEDLEIKSIAEKLIEEKKYKKIFIPFLRPIELAMDTSKTIDCVIYTVDKLKMVGEEYDYIVILQNTSPLRTTENVDESIKKIIDDDEESLVSVCEVFENPVLFRKINEKGKLEKIINKSSDTRRQNFEKYYKVNGAIYIQKNNEKFTERTILNEGKIPYKMDVFHSIDIDVYEDVQKVIEILECNSKEI